MLPVEEAVAEVRTFLRCNFRKSFRQRGRT